MKYTIGKVAVLGAGVMGAGIAAHLVGAGLPVYLFDMLPGELNDKEKAEGLTMESPEFRNRYALAGKDRVLKARPALIYHKSFGDLIRTGNYTDDLHLLEECDWVIEVIIENLDAKKNLMRQINAHIKPGTIVSTNTSGISINRICEDMPKEFKQHFLGTHFFNPVRYMKLIELIPSNDCLPEVMNFMNNFCTKDLGKGVVIAKDTPNFIANCVGVYGSIGTLRLTEKYGYSFSKVDQLTGEVVGRPKSATYRTTDMVGLDVSLNVIQNFLNSVNDPEKLKGLTIPSFVEDLAKKGYLGDKAGMGYYKRVKDSKGQKSTLEWDYKTGTYVEMIKDDLEAVKSASKFSTLEDKIKSMVYGEHEENNFVWENISRLLLFCAENVPQITDDFRQIDRAIEWGYNWKIGPFRLWDAIGLKESVARIKAEGGTVPAWVEERIQSGKESFYEENSFETPYLNLKNSRVRTISENKDAALLDIGDDVICLEFRSKSNAINDGIKDMFVKAFNELEGNYKGMVIGNQAKNFCVGANLYDLLLLARDRAWDKIGERVESFQKMNMTLKYFKKPIVAAIHGMTLGGGMEIAMSSHKVLAHAETYMGLVEVGVGLLPGGGGIKELLLRKMDNQAEGSVHQLIPQVGSAFQKISGASVSSSAHEGMFNGYLKKADRIILNLDYLLEEAKKEVIWMAENGFKPLRKSKIKVVGSTGKAALLSAIEKLFQGGYISEHDKLISSKIAHVISGGNVPGGTLVEEDYLLDLEKEAFVSLTGEEKTLQRMEYMLSKGKPLRN